MLWDTWRVKHLQAGDAAQITCWRAANERGGVQVTSCLFPLILSSTLCFLDATGCSFWQLHSHTDWLHPSLHIYFSIYFPLEFHGRPAAASRSEDWTWDESADINISASKTEESLETAAGGIFRTGTRSSRNTARNSSLSHFALSMKWGGGRWLLLHFSRMNINVDEKVRNSFLFLSSHAGGRVSRSDVWLPVTPSHVVLSDPSLRRKKATEFPLIVSVWRHVEVNKHRSLVKISKTRLTTSFVSELWSFWSEKRSSSAVSGPDDAFGVNRTKRIFEISYFICASSHAVTIVT